MAKLPQAECRCKNPEWDHADNAAYREAVNNLAEEFKLKLPMKMRDWKKSEDMPYMLRLSLKRRRSAGRRRGNENSTWQLRDNIGQLVVLCSRRMFGEALMTNPVLLSTSSLILLN
ncbi:hypothetical protein Q8A73_019964 [Channa argus]|nr:hypothetical protein Q8A73_019964 [Channa argus]